MAKIWSRLRPDWIQSTRLFMSNQSHGLWINRFQEILHCKWRTNYQIVSYESLRQSIECDQWFKLELFNPGGSEKLWRINTALFWYDNPTFLLMSGDWNEIRTHAFQIPLFQSQWSLRFFKCCFLPKQALDAESWKTVFLRFQFRHNRVTLRGRTLISRFRGVFDECFEDKKVKSNFPILHKFSDLSRFPANLFKFILTLHQKIWLKEARRSNWFWWYFIE